MVVADVDMLLSKWLGRIQEGSQSAESKWKHKIAMSDGQMLFLVIKSEYLKRKMKVAIALASGGRNNHSPKNARRITCELFKGEWFRLLMLKCVRINYFYNTIYYNVVYLNFLRKLYNHRDNVSSSV